MDAAQTILNIYEKDMIDLLHNEAIDLISLLDDEQLDVFFSANPEFITLSTGDYRNLKDLKEMIDMLVNFLNKL